MPELPEVENVRRSLLSLGVTGQIFLRVELRRGDIRAPINPRMSALLARQTMGSIERRAKYLIFRTEKMAILSHLGMTGSWRACEADGRAIEAHDHVIFHFESGLKLIYNDPRRFGLLEVLPLSAVAGRLDRLGLEPLDERLDGQAIYDMTRNRRTPVKSFIMDQRRIVGVGNIYASEALHRAGVRPTRRASRLSRRDCERLAAAIKAVIDEAIVAGGSTIRDYRDSNGKSGSFQTRFAVYGRTGEPCGACGQPVRAKTLNGRGTFWCSLCQV